MRGAAHPLDLLPGDPGGVRGGRVHHDLVVLPVLDHHLHHGAGPLAQQHRFLQLLVPVAAREHLARLVRAGVDGQRPGAVRLVHGLHADVGVRADGLTVLPRDHVGPGDVQQHRARQRLPQHSRERPVPRCLRVRLRRRPQPGVHVPVALVLRGIREREAETRGVRELHGPQRHVLLGAGELRELGEDVLGGVGALLRVRGGHLPEVVGRVRAQGGFGPALRGDHEGHGEPAAAPGHPAAALQLREQLQHGALLLDGPRGAGDHRALPVLDDPQVHAPTLRLELHEHGVPARIGAQHGHHPLAHLGHELSLGAGRRGRAGLGCGAHVLVSVPSARCRRASLVTGVRGTPGRWSGPRGPQPSQRARRHPGGVVCRVPRCARAARPSGPEPRPTGGPAARRRRRARRAPAPRAARAPRSSCGPVRPAPSVPAGRAGRWDPAPVVSLGP